MRYAGIKEGMYLTNVTSMSKKRSGLRMDESDIVLSDLLYIIHDVVTDET